MADDTKKGGQAQTEPDYLNRATFFPGGTFDGMPLDWAKDQVLDAVGVPKTTLLDTAEPHPLRAGLVNTHGAHLVDGVKYVPEPFPAEGSKGPLNTAGDYLTALDRAARVFKAPKEEAPPSAAPPDGQAVTA